LRLLLAEPHPAGRSRLLAGSLFLMFGRTVFYAFNGRRREDLFLRPNDIIQWHSIHDACDDGFRYYDFGEVEENQQGLAEFKAKWGADARRLHRYYYPAPPTLEADTFKSSSSARQLADAVWRRLPLNVTARLGGWAYSFL